MYTKWDARCGKNGVFWIFDASGLLIAALTWEQARGLCTAMSQELEHYERVRIPGKNHADQEARN